MSWRRLTVLGILGFVFIFFAALTAPASRFVYAQQPTGSIPTVTGTPLGPMVAVYLNLDQVDVYSGPSSYDYPAIGVMLAGEQAPALGRAEGLDWIEIQYLGVPDSIAWIYAPYVSLTSGADLPIVSVPPTPTPASTPTLNPTLVAALIPAVTSTRLSTFTPPAPIALPTFVDETRRPSSVPLGLVIAGFLFIGGLGAIISFLRGR
ncbi:MAG TPA: SH3 domain-containing protein [Anaerolineales bacterium]|nr:SH3 domain-containing protein [Anaerolineales bacterium]